MGIVSKVSGKWLLLVYLSRGPQGGLICQFSHWLVLMEGDSTFVSVLTV